MKKIYLALCLVCEIGLLAACGERACQSGAQVGAPWDKMDLPAVSGGEVCFSYENMLGIVHYKASHLELIHQYQEAYQQNGWTVAVEPAPAGSDMRFLKAAKGEQKVSISASECSRFPVAQFFSKCGLVQVSP